MRMRFDDFVELYRANHAVAPDRIVRLTGQGHYELVMQGSVFNRASDKEYVLDNVRDRATHIELAENRDLLFVAFPELRALVTKSDINLPPDEFFLMQDVYQLPDTGDWNTGQSIPAEALEEPPPLHHHMSAGLHEGMLIDNQVINALRRRASYIRVDDRFVRSRDNQFLVRPRTKKVLIVVDQAETREAIRKMETRTPIYTMDYYVLEEEGVNLKRLDRGDIEHIGLIRHLKARHQRPDVILFEPHRETQRRNTATTIMQQNARIDAKFRFRGIKCGQIDVGLSPEALNTEIMAFFAEDIRDTHEGDDGGGEESGRYAARKQPSGVVYDQRRLVSAYHAFATRAGRDTEAVRAGLSEAMRKASQLVMRIIDQKLLRSVHDEEALAAMSAEEKRKAIAQYVTDYHARVSRLRHNLFHETLLRATLDLARNAYAEAFGADHEERFKQAERELAAETLETLRETYREQGVADLGDQELVGLYQRDFTKLLQEGLIRRIGRELEIL